MSSSRSEPRSVALDVLRKLDGGSFAQFVLQQETRRAGLDRRDTRFVWELALGVERWRAYLDDAITPLLRRGLAKTDAMTLMIIRIGVYQLLFMDRVPARAAVHATVELAKARRGEAPARFVNGVLRALQRGKYSPPSDLSVPSLSIRQSHPEWLVERYIQETNLEDAEVRCQSQNRPAELTVRCPPTADRAAVMASLMEEGAEVSLTQWSPNGLRISGHPDPFNSSTFLQQEWVVQDESSQLTVELLGATHKESVWDVCAAPGGKTRYLCEILADGGQVFATDLSPKKLQKLAALLGGKTEFRVHDGREPLDPERRFDRVLLDAPCTALGLVRRHPEIRWRRSNQDVLDRASLQKKILENVANHVRPGGVLVYSVCSDTLEEGPHQIEAFLKSRDDFISEQPEDGDVQWSDLCENGLMRLYPHRQGCDGFFAARLRRLGDE